jgi:hypothetical protein
VISNGYKRSLLVNTISVGVFRSFLCVIHFLPVRAHLHHHQEAPTLVCRLSLHKSSDCSRKKIKSTRLAVCPHCQTSGSVRLLDRDCNQLKQKKNKTNRLAVCPHCQTGSIRLLDRDHNTASNIRQLRWLGYVDLQQIEKLARVPP